MRRGRAGDGVEGGRGAGGRGAVWPSVQTRCTAQTTSWICLLVILSFVEFWRDGQELDYTSAWLVHVDSQKVSS